MNIEKIFFVPKKNPNCKLRVFCFPFAGGSVNTFYTWLDKISNQVELVFVQPPARGSRIAEKPHESMESLVGELMESVQFICSKPYMLFGHSLGSRVAYELCCHLHRSGKNLPHHFIASGSRGPHVPSDKLKIYDLPQDEFVAELAKLNGTPKEVLANKELLDLLSPALRADFKLADTVSTNKIIMPFPITVFNGLEDQDIKPVHLKAWGDLSCYDSEIVNFPGGHFFINEHPSLVIAKVSSLVDKVLDELGHIANQA
jgi:surfactin synthase thioesterase subunit